MLKPYLYGAMALALVGTHYFMYNAGKQSVLQRLSNDRVEVIKDGQKVDAAVYAADDDGLVCLLIDCQAN
ncbi:hypothetical protein V19_31 [Brucella phage V_19]|uniref:Uncharacterized protein n=30 Tax=Perisivirus TaxID=1984798 RepID=H2EI68_9CAUD|nr:hypothetical protein [Brucella melitensis]YP_007002039.1 hypothetical protein F354_gp31 [Brucella phage Tb]YP_007002096.1 hypothetical protein F355_gp30 [Brucella phage Pr]AHB81090.1 hypothetical protein Bk_30 [Brucella phage Bk]AHB81147.1 hypothetical protein Fz_31 [Brucella phage Fz]AHB81204.1 hypothetical protein R/C_30 [Brucella phage R/C]AHB81260.1 hypothetical protein S708_30 [Brucella phage S708]AHB81374.1 hypothetical protein Wb_30 [Brucella phage Wb]AKO59019.1 hypothetical prote